MSSPSVVWVVVPFAREANLPLVVANFERQVFTDMKLVIVENGPAVGACARAGIKPDILLTSDAHQSDAKNTALAEIRRRGGGFWTTFDDDDWYGRYHVQEIANHAHRANVVGRGEHFVRLSDGLYLFRREYANRYANSVAGPTISAWTEDTIEFRRFTPGDTPDWCERMRAAGASFWNCDYRHFVYSRHSGKHAWSASDVEVRCAYGDALFFGDVPNDVSEHAANPIRSVPRPTSEEVYNFLDVS